MEILIACEFSAVVRDAFRAQGHNAWSIDLLPCEGNPTWHIQDNLIDSHILENNWDLLISHPPCTHLASSGARHFKTKQADGRQAEAIKFFLMLTKTPIPKWCIENPVGIMSTQYRKPDQAIQPYYYGHPVRKKTHLWLHGLPLLTEAENMPLFTTNYQLVEPELITTSTGKTFSQWEYDISKNHKTRAHQRSITFSGIAEAMAEQWG